MVGTGAGGGATEAVVSNCNARLNDTERRMLATLSRLDTVDENEALRRAIRLAFFARTVPDDLMQQMMGDSDPEASWRPTGEVRVSVRGDLVAERINDDGATKWVPATAEEIDEYFARPRRH
jgi:hypothetical protein